MPSTSSHDAVAEAIIEAYVSACAKGRTDDAFRVAAGMLMRLDPKLPLDEARRTVAEILCEYDGPAARSYLDELSRSS